MKKEQWILLEDWQNEIEMKEGAYGNKNRIIDSNPGFETTISHTEVSSGKTHL